MTRPLAREHLEGRDGRVEIRPMVSSTVEAQWTVLLTDGSLTNPPDRLRVRRREGTGVTHHHRGRVHLSGLNNLSLSIRREQAIDLAHTLIAAANWTPDDQTLKGGR